MLTITHRLLRGPKSDNVECGHQTLDPLAHRARCISGRGKPGSVHHDVCCCGCVGRGVLPRHRCSISVACDCWLSLDHQVVSTGTSDRFARVAVLEMHGGSMARVEVRVRRIILRLVMIARILMVSSRMCKLLEMIIVSQVQAALDS